MRPQKLYHCKRVVCYKQGKVHHKCWSASCFQGRTSFCQWGIEKKNTFPYFAFMNDHRVALSSDCWLWDKKKSFTSGFATNAQLHLCLLVVGQTVWSKTKWLSTSSVGEVVGVEEPTQASSLVWHHLVSRCEGDITPSRWVLEKGSVCWVRIMQVNKVRT